MDNRVHAEELKDVYIANGNEVAVHGKNHLSLAGLPVDRDNNWDVIENFAKK